jgi:hypothetical protein
MPKITSAPPANPYSNLDSADILSFLLGSMRSINLSSPEGSYSLYFPPETNIDAIAKRSHPLNRVPTIRREAANKAPFMQRGGLAAALALATSLTKQIR